MEKLSKEKFREIWRSAERKDLCLDEFPELDLEKHFNVEFEPPYEDYCTIYNMIYGDKYTDMVTFINFIEKRFGTRILKHLFPNVHEKYISLHNAVNQYS